MEILVRVIDKEQPDPVLNPLVSKRGDLIVSMPDGHGWSELERTEDYWRIIRCPILQTHKETLEQQKYFENKARRRREYSIDFSKLPNPQLYEGTRTVDIIDVSRKDLIKATTKKP